MTAGPPLPWLALLTAAVLAVHLLLGPSLPWSGAPTTTASPMAIQVVATRQPATASTTTSAAWTPTAVEPQRALPPAWRAADQPVPAAKPPPSVETMAAPSEGLSTAPRKVPPPQASSAPEPEPPSTEQGVLPEATAHPAAALVATVAQTQETAEANPSDSWPRRMPPSRELTYHVSATRKGLSLPAQSRLVWSLDGDRYRASLEIRAPLAGSRTQTSAGSASPDTGLQPERFGDRNRQEQAAHFDRSRSPALIRFSGNTPDSALLAHSQDRLSVLVELAALLLASPQRLGAGESVVLHTAGARDADLWRFVVEGRPTLSLDSGPIDTVHLVRAARQAYDTRIELWMAPSLGYLPARMLWTQGNGDVVDQRLSGHSP